MVSGATSRERRSESAWDGAVMLKVIRLVIVVSMRPVEVEVVGMDHTHIDMVVTYVRSSISCAG